MAAAEVRRREPVTDSGGFDALYQRHWWPMVRLACGLVDQVAAAEEVVQDAFTALYRKWPTLRDEGAALGYLRVSVVNGSRSALRHRIRGRARLQLVREDSVPAADEAALLGDEYDTVRKALAGLPDRQREVLTLRYLLDLPDQDIAAATGLSLGGVRSASSRGLAALRVAMGELA